MGFFPITSELRQRQFRYNWFALPLKPPSQFSGRIQFQWFLYQWRGSGTNTQPPPKTLDIFVKIKSIALEFLTDNVGPIEAVTNDRKDYDFRWCISVFWSRSQGIIRSSSYNMQLCIRLPSLLMGAHYVHNISAMLFPAFTIYKKNTWK